MLRRAERQVRLTSFDTSGALVAPAVEDRRHPRSPPGHPPVRAQALAVQHRHAEIATGVLRRSAAGRTGRGSPRAYPGQPLGQVGRGLQPLHTPGPWSVNRGLSTARPNRSTAAAASATSSVITVSGMGSRQWTSSTVMRARSTAVLDALPGVLHTATPLASRCRRICKPLADRPAAGGVADLLHDRHVHPGQRPARHRSPGSGRRTAQAARSTTTVAAPSVRSAAVRHSVDQAPGWPTTATRTTSGRRRGRRPARAGGRRAGRSPARSGDPSTRRPDVKQRARLGQREAGVEVLVVHQPGETLDANPSMRRLRRASSARMPARPWIGCRRLDMQQDADVLPRSRPARSGARR